MKRAFTLIELLVVIAIIAILAAILFPVFAQAKEAAKKTQEISNHKQQGTSTQMYLADYDDTFPLSNSGSINGIGWGFGPPDSIVSQVLQPYQKNTNIHVSPMDGVGDNEREKLHCTEVGQPYLGWNCNAMTAEQKLYGRMARSNIGYNYGFFSPWIYRASGDRYVGSLAVNASEVGQVAGTIIYGTSIWDRTAGGGPKGGGNWVIETPCWLDENGVLLSPMSRAGADLWSYGTGWSTTNDWLIYGGLWPFYNQKAVTGFPGLKDGNVIIGFADSHVKGMHVKATTAGCSGFGTGVRNGRRFDKDKFLWDLD